MATVNGAALPASQSAALSDSVLRHSEGGRGAPRPNPEVVARAKRRRFTAALKLQVLAEADAARASGEIGSVLRRHGLYSSHLTKWRQERKVGILEGLTPHKRGPKTKVTAATLENQRLQRENERLTEQLRRAEIVIDVQKKVAALLGRPFPQTETL